MHENKLQNLSFTILDIRLTKIGEQGKKTNITTNRKVCKQNILRFHLMPTIGSEN